MRQPPTAFATEVQVSSGQMRESRFFSYLCPRDSACHSCLRWRDFQGKFPLRAMPNELKYRRLAHMQSHGLDVGLEEPTAIGFRGSELGGSAGMDESGLRDAEKCEDCAEIRFDEVE